jgi:uncharacterized protein YndB with AHSA1/START domain
MMQPLELEFTVSCSPDHAFDVWANRASLWWPRDHTMSAHPGLTVTFEPHTGGRIYERTPEGVEHEWGEVLAWQPPHRLVYLWHIAADRKDATEVEITFASAEDGTTVTIVHRGWERLGARGRELHDRNRQGWAGLISHYVKACLGPPA